MDLNTIELRPIQKTDYPQLEAIIRKTWNYDQLSDHPKDARHMARLYLRCCLRRATFSCVATAGGRVLGILLAGSKKSAPKIGLRRMLSQLAATLLLFTTRSGCQIGRFFQVFDQADSRLLKSCQRSFDAEICFFAVEEETRGAGVGKMLFSAALSYLKKEGASSFYLFTDSSCTYQFYEKRGMQRLEKEVVSLAPYIDYRLEMFLYGYDLPQEC